MNITRFVSQLNPRATRSAGRARKLATLLAVCCLSTAGWANDTDARHQAGQGKPAKAASTVKFMPVYKPPQSHIGRGAPRGRIGGGTRGNGSLKLRALVPDHTGLTTQASPSLYWYASAPVRTRVEVTLIDEKADDPLLEKTLDGSGGAGIQRLDLAAFNVKLKPNVEYEWFITAVQDEKARSGDVIAGGVIKRVGASEVMQTQLRGAKPGASPGSRAAVFAEHGIWYDAMDELSRDIARHPDDAALREQRMALLKQVGLTEVTEQ